MAREPTKVVVTETRAENISYQARQDLEANAKRAMEDLPEHSLPQKSAIPVGPDEEAGKERKKQEDLERKQQDLMVEQADKMAHGEGKPLKQKFTAADMFPVILLKSYTPMEAYCVREGDTMRLKERHSGEVFDKVQAGSSIGLPTAEARKIVGLKIAERADEIK